ncbi:MAG: hypothetical protein ACKVQU_06530, partial [Burkholderiales bacterium]
MPLFDDEDHDDGAMEPDGVYNHRLSGIPKSLDSRLRGNAEFLEAPLSLPRRGGVRRGLLRHPRGGLVDSSRTGYR